MSNSLSPYLSFAGRCAEAMEFYKDVLGGTLHMMRHSEAPPPYKANGEMAHQIMHARLAFDGGTIMASDIPANRYTPPSPMIQLAVSFDTVERAERVFNALSQGGQVFMPLAETFWAHRFGMLADRFGVSWMVNVEKPMSAPV